ncbi:MAG: Eco57I restriction-modification methylase domain-containing protein [Erysipelotrichaceae bacterium]|nr:Eco57I restriction-modification methylase domain-containing protein [Solobacterium sp.]MDY5402158.1 Eco57I restriction-modification methylase domain-containing protein [Erysipelotrichaceae bacterium]
MENENQKLIDITSYPIVALLDKLLEDKTTKKNIIWATDVYAFFGDGFQDKNQILSSAFIMGRALTIRPRIEKNLEEQQLRTKKKAEVFTPAWLCNQMNNYLDEDWFGSKSVFNVENKDNTWTYNTNKIIFDKNKSWEDYIKTRCLEITCGEAPFLVSRYDTSTGVLILPPFNRIGLLDRKLRIVNENIDDEKEWIKWVTKAYQNTYGFEYQGDNLLIARINLLLTFIDYYKDKFNKDPELKLLQKITNIIAWNIWQMDGLKDTVPLGKPFVEHEQIGLDLFGDAEKEKVPAIPCVIKDWRANKTLLYMDCKENNMSKKFFDYVIGNPPYQETRETTKDMPVYNSFMDEAYKIANVVELITPARFLFNAGATPKDWNKKILNDEHFKVLKYVSDSAKVFSNTEIKGGVSIHYRNNNIKFGAIEIFTEHPELNVILNKVKKSAELISLNTIMYPYSTYTLSEKLWEDYPEKKKEVEYIAQNRNKLKKEEKEGKLSNLRIITTNIFDLLSKSNWGVDLFHDTKPNDDEYIGIIGRQNNSRQIKYIKSCYIDAGENYNKYKVILPAVNGSGNLGETLSTPFIGKPFEGYTQTFLGIGSFETIFEAEAAYKYICTKFARTLLGVLKITQHNPPEKWKYVPLQDFTSNSDIDWSKSIHEIDLQLYKKYGLDEKEIEFIETHVKEMN